MRGSKAKIDIPYLAIFSVILIVAVIVSLILFPEWRKSPALIIVLVVAAAVGVVSFASGFRSAFIRDQGDAPPAKLDYDAPQHRRNQENVCANVRSAWIDGVLRESLPERVRLVLALDSLPDMVQRRMVHLTGRTAREPVSEAHLADLFRGSGRALLILGAPGSGKTVTLLELCEPILEGAEADPRRPVPVVLNLSTWAQKRAPLEAWIIDEMSRQYGLNRRVTPVWLAADHLILLLDGLDEVAPDARDACVRAINAFRETHGAGMVVCSRSADYAELSERLALSRAVEIRPLEPEQIDDYLSDERLGLAAVRQAIAGDDALRELATTPLMLNVMAVAYGGRPYSELLPLLDNEAGRRAHLYDAYLARVFARRPLAAAGYTSAQALRWLRFLAARLTERDETQFFIEDMQSDWLPDKHGHWVGMLFFGLFGVSFGMLFGGLFGVAPIGLNGGLEGGLFGALVGGVLFGVLNVVLANLVGRPEHITPVDELSLDLSPRAIRKVVKFGVLGGALLGILVWLTGVPGDALYDVVFGVLAGMLVVGLFVVQIDVIRPSESKRRIRPNQGILRSVANALRGGLLGGLLGGLQFSVLFLGLLGVLFREMFGGFAGGVIIVGGVVGGVVGWMEYGGKAVMMHYILRLLLALHHLPLRLIPFLEAMRERILIQRAGAHYRFIHRTFQEHIAALTDERIEALAASPAPASPVS